MPYPQVDCNDLTPLPDECCSSLFDKGEAILAHVAPFMQECAVPVPCCGNPLRYFVALGRPETWQSDFLSIHVENMQAVGQREGRSLLPVRLAVQWRFILMESCYPGLVPLSENEWATPDDDQFHLANRYAYAHAQALLRGLLDYVNEHDCSSFRFRDLQPLQIQNYSAGWTLGFDLEL